MLVKDSFETYRDTDAVNASLLKKLRVSPLNAFFAPEKDTDSLQFGRLYHEYIFEPEQFTSNYYIYDEKKRPEPLKNMGSTKNKMWKEHILKRNKGKMPLTVAQRKQLSAMLNNLHKYAGLAMSLIESSECEKSLYTEIKVNGDVLPVKCRFDCINVERGAILDLKTTKNASPGEFSREAGQYAYHLQAAFYLRLAEAVYKKPFKFFILAQETTAPYNVALREVSDSMRAKGDHELIKLLNEAAHVRKTGEIESYNVFANNQAGIMPLDIPDYYVMKNDFNHHLQIQND